MNVELTLEGGAALAESLTALGQAVARRISRQALKAGANPMVAAARARIHSITGLLAGGLAARVGRGDFPGRTSVVIQALTTRARFARVTGRKVKPGKNRGFRVYYGTFVELGHKTAGGGRVPAHPFMRSAFDAQVSGTADIIQEELGRGIDAAT